MVVLTGPEEQLLELWHVQQGVPPVLYVHQRQLHLC